jgi:DNA polymerase-3 subunit epsilon
MFKWLRQQLTPPNYQDDAPAFVKAYYELFAESTLDKKLPLAEIPFIVYDTETTGLDHKKDKLLSIGAVKVKAWQIDLANHLEVYLEQDYRPNSGAEAISVHGILPKGHQAAVTETEALEQFLGFAGKGVLVAHHLAFDRAMIEHLLKFNGGGKLLNKGVDTAVLARRLTMRPDLAKRGDFGLDHLCEVYRIPMSDRHTAAGDAYITAVLLMKLLSRLEKRGVRTLEDLLSTRNSGLR